MGFGVVILFAIFPFLSLAICFVVLYTAKNKLKICREEIANPKGSMLRLVIKAWVMDVTALYISLIIMLIVSMIVPFFSGIHSEWGMAYDQAYFPAVVYIFGWSLLYAILSFSSIYCVYGSEITDRWKSKKLFLAFTVTSAIIWTVIMCLLFTVPW